MATYPSNLILAGGGQANPSTLVAAVRPVYGSVVVPAGVTIAANDTLPLFNIGAGSAAHITGYMIDGGAMDAGTTLTMSLLDSLTPTPTTIFNAVTSFRTAAVLTHATAARASIGAAVSYTAPNLLFLRAIAGGTGALATAQTIYFVFELARD